MNTDSPKACASPMERGSRMIFSNFRFWLASKILGGLVVQEIDIQAEKNRWVKEQLDHGNIVTLEYSVVTPIKKWWRKSA